LGGKRTRKTRCSQKWWDEWLLLKTSLKTCLQKLYESTTTLFQNQW
jgi:hypothetical protein